MRALLLALLLAPLAAASPSTPPWEFERASVSGSGAVGDAIDVILRVRANAGLDARIELRAPEWVQVEGDAWDARASAGEVVEREWRLTPTREGFWAAIAHADPDEFGGACACVLGFAGGPPESIVATSAEEAVPVALLDRTLSVAAQEDGTTRIERALIPVSSWLAHAELHGWITPGSTCDQCAIRLPDPAHEARGRGNETVVATATLPLREGDAYTLWDEVVVSFETPPDATLQPSATVRTGCENRRWGTEESWSCEQASREWSHVVTAAPLALAIGLALLVAARRR